MICDEDGNMKHKEDGRFSRRQFLGLAWATSLVGLFGQAGVALLDFFKPRPAPGGFGGKVSAGQVAEFEPGTVNHVREGRFFISRFEDGGMLALWHQCTHLGCTVPWREDEDRFHCPCHSSIFNRKGEVVSGPAPRPLDTFPIEIVDGEIVVDTGNPRRRDRFDSSQLMYG
jgi:cytochrome b6-f complex iron-sulfur subunit